MNISRPPHSSQSRQVWSPKNRSFPKCALKPKSNSLGGGGRFPISPCTSSVKSEEENDHTETLLGTPPRKEASPPCDPALTGGPRSPPSAWTTSRREDARSPASSSAPRASPAPTQEARLSALCIFFYYYKAKLAFQGHALAGTFTQLWV